LIPFPFTITFLLFKLLTADSLWKYIQSCHNIYCLLLLLLYYFENIFRDTIVMNVKFEYSSECVETTNLSIFA